MKKNKITAINICMALSLAVIGVIMAMAMAADNQIYDGPATGSSYPAPVQTEAAASSPLLGKKIVYDGDSISESRQDNGGAYARLIAEQTGSVYVNHARGGACLTTLGEGEDHHSVVDNLENLPKNGDLYCFEGGINDLWRSKPLGTYDPDDMTGDLDETTVCGALETIFRYAREHFAGKPVCFVITHRIKDSSFQAFRDAMVGICQKYDVPYYDAFTESELNGHDEEHSALYLTGNSQGTPDGCHPNEEGYLRFYVPQLTALFEQII